MKRLSIFLLATLFTAALTQAQTLNTSPFKRLPAIHKYGINVYGVATTQKATAWRFTAAAAAYDVVNNKVLTGIGYGFNTMHLKTDSTGSHWYTDFTVNLSVYAAGNAAPSYSYGNTNIIGVGPSIGILNKLINVGYVFYPAMNGSPAKSGVIAGVSIPLN